MDVNFNEMPWHDAELLNIAIDRRQPGQNDIVIIDICWPNGKKGTFIFRDCYGLVARMNFGVLAPESILDASTSVESQELREMREKWGQIGVDIGQLKCFELRTNSTASILRVFALGYIYHDEGRNFP